MNLLNCELPTSICLIDEDLQFDVDIDHEKVDSVYEIATDYRTILDIMIMYEDGTLTPQEQAYCMLRMLYLDNIPEDEQKAFELAMLFLNCGENDTKKSNTYQSNNGSLYSWSQDGNYIYAAINQSHNDILERVPDLHWWKFVNCFQNIKEDCRFSEILCNRLAYKKKKMTKEQKTARKEFPEIYVLNNARKIDKVTEARADEFERLLNS